MEVRKSKLKLVLGAGCALAVLASAAGASAEERTFNVASARAADTIPEFARQAGIQIVAPADRLQGVKTPAIEGSYDTRQALAMLIAGTGLHVASDDGRTVMLSADPQSGSAAGGGADQGTVQALIVTAQKKEEQIQDVPIAISAFTEKSLEEQKIEGGFDLLKAIPNVTFSKNNFTSYNFSIRGIGTKAVSATTDPAVAVSFNNMPLLQNRLFEQEYFDVERVEVLRGPQGTLYGRNATAGVINLITAKPNLSEFKGWVKGEVGNYQAKRISAMVNVPLVEDKLAIRFAGAMTDRQGYDYNLLTKSPVNGRDLWSGRITVAFNPTDRLRTNLVWERFHEDDNRSRTGKQLCHRDDGPEEIGGLSVVGSDPNPEYTQLFYGTAVRRAPFSLGCKPGSLYEDAAFGTPNGFSYNFVLSMLSLRALYNVGYLGDAAQSPIQAHDPYAGVTQSRDLRTIASVRNPIYRAGADVVNLNVDFDLAPAVTLTSQTVYNKDRTYSFQDFNRFNTQPIFTDTSPLIVLPWDPRPSFYRDLAPGGIFCDPQLGCSDRMAGFDLAKANGEQFTQEIRLQSSFEGPLNFSVGANYTQFRTLIDYYIMFNLLTALAETTPINYQSAAYDSRLGGQFDRFDPSMCYDSHFFGFLSGIVSGRQVGLTPVPTSDPRSVCPYVDPNPLNSMNGEGHNYFRSKNPYRLRSGGLFGELYWQIAPELKLTAGLRYSDDHKLFIPVPSQVLTARGFIAGGVVSKGYPADPPIKQHWGEWTGRLGIDWKPDLSFTDQTLLYAFYSRGYKAGGANPPSPGFATAEQERADVEPIFFQNGPYLTWMVNGILDVTLPVLQLTGNDYGSTFEPEFVNAFEVGSKNTLLGGGLVLNGDAFFYDYKNYQVSQIRDRTAVNENFDAKAWGAELQSVFSPSRNLQIIANIGYLDTRIADGETSIDVMDRTQGNPNYVVVKPWAQLPSNCVAPVAVVQKYLTDVPANVGYWRMCGHAFKGALGLNFLPLMDPTLGGEYDPVNYPEIHGGAGIPDDLGGNELPNAPHWTVNLGAQYGFDFLEGWRATVRGDAYWQSQSWARVYNSDPYDKLHGWYNVNLSMWLERPEDGLKIELYAKNILDKSPITDSFLNSDDTGLTTNVFTLDPRLIGLSIRKDF